MVNFPVSLDSLTNPSNTDPLNNPSHSTQHQNANDAIEALEAKVGITASTPTAGKVFSATGTGISEWTNSLILGVEAGEGFVSGKDATTAATVGGDINLGSGAGSTTGEGGTVYVYGGNGGATNANGGSIYIYGGDAGGSGTDGNVILGDPGKVHISKEGSNLVAILDANTVATTDKTFTFPNATGTFVLNDNTVTLTNKSLTLPVISQFGTASGVGSAWSTWSVGVYTNITIGNGTVTAVLKQVGKTIFAHWTLVMGSTTSIGNGAAIPLPVTAASRYGTSSVYSNIGEIIVYDLSATTPYFGTVATIGSTTQASLLFPSTNTLISTFPITEATGDTISVSLVYEYV